MDPKNAIIRTSLLVLVFVLFAATALPVVGAGTQAFPATASDLSEIEFALTGTETGWLRFGGRLFHTENNGIAWQDVTPTPDQSETLVDVYFLNTNQAIALTVGLNGVGWKLELLKTGDSGSSWHATTVIVPEHARDFENVPFGDAFIQWQNDQNGWILVRQATSINFSVGILMRTSDGGQSWTVSEPPAAEEFVFVDEKLGFMRDPTDATRLFQTQDGGSSWQSILMLGVNLAVDELEQVGLPIKWQGGQLLLPVWVHREEFQPRLVFLAAERDTRGSVEGTAWVQATGTLDPQPWEITPASELRFSHISSFDGKSLWLGLSGSKCAQNTLAGEEDLPLVSATCTNEFLLLSSQDAGAHWQLVGLPSDILTAAANTIQEGGFQNMPEVDQELHAVQWVQVFQGQGFDACEIPSLSKLQAWFNSSPYKSVNLYIGGISRYCDNNALTAAYLQQMFNQGWRFIPTWVGPQAPCTNFNHRFSWDPDEAYAEGVDNANQARARLLQLGLTNPDGTGSIVYDDLEYFPYSAACSAAAREFVRGWTTRLQQLGIISGLYASSWNLDQNEIYNLQPPPYAAWIAEWYRDPGYRPDVTVWDVDWLDDIYWSNHQRVYQYSGGHNETWGGVTINVDSNVLDGIVAAPYGADLTAPVTGYNAAGTIGITPWYKTPVTVTLTATDNSAGVKRTYYRINAGSWQIFTAPFSVSGSGKKTINYMSVDLVYNWESMKTASFYVDSEPPVNPVVTSPGCQAWNGVPQAWCNNPWFTWAGAYDVGVGLNPTDTYEVYWGTDKTATSGTRTSATQLNPPAIPTGVPYYLRIRTQDKHGLWSAWQTIYTLIYDYRFTHQLWLPRVAK